MKHYKRIHDADGWPATLPALEPENMYQGSNFAPGDREGTCKCLWWWAMVFTDATNFLDSSASIPQMFELKLVEVARRLYPQRFPLPEEFDGYRELPVINDHILHNTEELARVWNTAREELGYIEEVQP